MFFYHTFPIIWYWAFKHVYRLYSYQIYGAIVKKKIYNIPLSRMNLKRFKLKLKSNVTLFLNEREMIHFLHLIFTSTCQGQTISMLSCSILKKRRLRIWKIRKCVYLGMIILWNYTYSLRFQYPELRVGPHQYKYCKTCVYIYILIFSRTAEPISTKFSV